jgi:hypothetical protein
MITNKMRKQLGDLGYSPEDIQAMMPAGAHAALQAGSSKPTKEFESGAASPAK